MIIAVAIQTHHVTFVRNEEVVGFDIAVKHPALMTEVQAFQDHLHVSFDICWRQCQAPVFDDDLQICLHVLKYLTRT